MKNYLTCSKTLTILVLSMLCSAPLVAGETVMYYYSTQGDYIGASNEVTLTQQAPADFGIASNDRAGVTFTASNQAHITDSAELQNWTVFFSMTDDSPLVVGHYLGATHPDSYGHDTPGLSVSGNDRACTSLLGRFDILEIEYNETSGIVSAFAADFVQYCGSARSQPLFGSVRFNSDVPITRIPDNDSDQIPDEIDLDDDNDGIEDEHDAFPKNAGESQDSDSDGIGDNTDPTPNLCPNTIFSNGKIWSGDIQYVDNTCISDTRGMNEDQMCSGVYFSDEAARLVAVCAKGQWQALGATTEENFSPQARVINMQASHGEAPYRVILDGSLSNDDNDHLSYAWDFGDGSLSQGAIGKHTYTTPGVYSVTLTVTDDIGQEDSITIKDAFTVTAPVTTAPEACPNSVFDDGKMWSADIMYVDNTCSNAGQLCPQTYFIDKAARFDADCRDGQWQVKRPISSNTPAASQSPTGATI